MASLSPPFTTAVRLGAPVMWILNLARLSAFHPMPSRCARRMPPE